MAKTHQELLARLEVLGIAAQTAEHQQVFTVAESQAVRDSLAPGSPGGIGGGHSKNLFLRNKKKAMWLVTLLETREIDLKTLGEQLDAGRLSFGSADRLMNHLGVQPGAVTPFSVINDEEKVVTMVLDQGFLDFDWLHFHPLRNDMTTMLRPQDLLTFLKAEGHEPLIVDFS